MRIALIEGSPDFVAAIKSLLDRLLGRFKLVIHRWEDSSSNSYIGYFLASFPDKLQSYKLRDFETPDAYHLCRYWTESQESGNNYSIKSKFEDFFDLIKDKYPDCDKLLDLDGVIVLDDGADVRSLLSRFGVKFEIYNGYVYPDIVDVHSDGDDDSYTNEISVDDFISDLDSIDLPVIAKRLYNILEGGASRWVEYRLDTKRSKPLVDFDAILRQVLDQDEDADGWKQ